MAIPKKFRTGFKGRFTPFFLMGGLLFILFLGFMFLQPPETLQTVPSISFEEDKIKVKFEFTPTPESEFILGYYLNEILVFPSTVSSVKIKITIEAKTGYQLDHVGIKMDTLEEATITAANTGRWDDSTATDMFVQFISSDTLSIVVEGTIPNTIETGETTKWYTPNDYLIRVNARATGDQTLRLFSDIFLIFRLSGNVQGDAISGSTWTEIERTTGAPIEPAAPFEPPEGAVKKCGQTTCIYFVEGKPAKLYIQVVDDPNLGYYYALADVRVKYRIDSRYIPETGYVPRDVPDQFPTYTIIEDVAGSSSWGIYYDEATKVYSRTLLEIESPNQLQPLYIADTLEQAYGEVDIVVTVEATATKFQRSTFPYTVIGKKVEAYEFPISFSPLEIVIGTLVLGIIYRKVKK